MQMVSKLDMPLPLYLRLGTCSWLCWATLLPSKPRLDLSSLHFYSRENVQKSNPIPPVSPAFHKSYCKYVWGPTKPVLPSNGMSTSRSQAPEALQTSQPVVHPSHQFLSPSVPPSSFSAQNLVLIFKGETVSKSSAILLW